MYISYLIIQCFVLHVIFRTNNNKNVYMKSIGYLIHKRFSKKNLVLRHTIYFAKQMESNE